MLGSLTHDEIVVEAKGGFVDKVTRNRCVLKLRKPVSSTFDLRILLGKLYGAVGFRSAAEVFKAKI